MEFTKDSHKLACLNGMMKGTKEIYEEYMEEYKIEIEEAKKSIRHYENSYKFNKEHGLDTSYYKNIIKELRNEIEEKEKSITEMLAVNGFIDKMIKEID